MSSSQIVFTHKKVSKYLWENDIRTLQNGRKIVEIIHICVTRAIYILFYDDQDTGSE